MRIEVDVETRSLEYRIEDLFAEYCASFEEACASTIACPGSTDGSWISLIPSNGS